MNRTEAMAFETKLNQVADKRHLRVVPVDPQLLFDYMEHRSYEEWDQEQSEV